MYEALTKFNGEVADPGQLPFLLRHCFRTATTGKTRPVHLDIPNHMGRTTEAAEIREPLAAAPEYGRYPAIRSAAPDEQVRRAADAISQSARPVIVAGRGVYVSDAGKELVALAEKGDIPVMTTPDGKTMIDEHHPLWAGIAGGYGMGCCGKILNEADLVIFIGTQTSDQTTRDWTAPPPCAKVVQIDIDPEELGRNYPLAIGVLGDANTVLLQLLNCVAQKARPNGAVGFGMPCGHTEKI
jgi:acetolactate synthase-1/2/3 large subunit